METGGGWRPHFVLFNYGQIGQPAMAARWLVLLLLLPTVYLLLDRFPCWLPFGAIPRLLYNDLVMTCDTG
jgi:hypothetical protein